MAAYSPRDIGFDAIRAIALFLVVLVHTHQGPTALYPLNVALQTVLFFFAKLGVPLFVMVSGALLLPKVEPIQVFYKKRLGKIILPWVFWSFIYLLYKTRYELLDIHSPFLFVKNFLIVALSDFWFIPMILGVYVVTPYLRVIVQNKISLQYLLIAWFCITSLAPLFFLSPLFPGSASAGIFAISLCFCGYFLLGWYAKNNFVKHNTNGLLITSILVSAIVYLCFTYLFQSNSNSLFFATQDYFSPSILIGSAALFILIYKNTKSLLKVPKKTISEVSSLSYGIFLSHVLVSQIILSFLPTFLMQENILSWLIRAILVYSSSAAVIFFGTKIPHLKKFIT